MSVIASNRIGTLSTTWSQTQDIADLTKKIGQPDITLKHSDTISDKANREFDRRSTQIDTDKADKKHYLFSLSVGSEANFYLLQRKRPSVSAGPLVTVYLSLVTILRSCFPARHILEHFGGENVHFYAHGVKFEGSDLLVDFLRKDVDAGCKRALVLDKVFGR